MWLNWPGYISSIILYPVANVLMYTLIGRLGGSTVNSAFALGIVIFSMSFSSVNGLAQSYSYDLYFGTMSFFYASRANRLKNYLARAVLHFPNALLAFVLGLATSCYAANLHLSGVSWTPLVLAVLSVAFSLICFGQLLGLISMVTRNWLFVQGIALGLLMLLCGAIIPTDILPKLFAIISRAMPITNGLRAARAGLTGANMDKAGADILHELVVGFSYCVLAYVAFRIFEIRVRHTGALERDMQ